jgi:hypothetical protein
MGLIKERTHAMSNKQYSSLEIPVDNLTDSLTVTTLDTFLDNRSDTPSLNESTLDKFLEN